jgi:1-acyl-sn-glycerol-3-phosphate acyltransferase
MAYQLLKYLFKFAQFFYFKRIEIVGQKNIPKNEGNILVSNHPSAFKDPILVSVNLPQALYYVAAKEFLGPKRMANFLEKKFNIIPIYRPQTRPDELHKNTESFRKCYKALNRKKSIAIYAEGVSETIPWLAPIKSGTARIAFEALEKYPELEKVNIISMGYNYSNPHEFRSTFLLHIGECFEITQHCDLNKEGVTKLAQQHIESSMNALES